MNILAFATNLSWIDWTIVLALLAAIVYLAFYSNRYNKSVADFLAANRCTRRYLLGIANGMAGLGAISIIGQFQGNFNGGFANIWWGWAGVPFWTLIFITGFVAYRMRETRVLTLSQFFEVRYSRRFRIFAGILCFIAGVVNFGIFPAVGARFFQHFCGLPAYFEVGNYMVETYPVLMIILLAISLFFVFAGGQIAVILTDFVQGAFTNVVFLVILVFLIFYVVDWGIFSEVVKASAGEGKSKVNPFDGAQNDWNFNFFLIGLIGSMYGLGSWQGTQGYTASSASAHETKMAGILGEWRGLTQIVIMLLLPLTVFMVLGSGEFLNNPQKFEQQIANTDKQIAKLEQEKPPYYQEKVNAVKAERSSLQKQKTDTLAAIDRIRNERGQHVLDKYQQIQKSVAATEAKIKRKPTLEDPTNLGGDQVADQMRVPVALSKIFPVGIIGLFAAMMLAAFISTHDTYLHSWGSVFIQDVIMPFRKKPFSKKTHMWLLRISITMVAVIIFMFSYFFQQIDHIQMFFNASAALFVGGAGICIIGGLYTRTGTTAGAWTGLIVGAITALGGIILQQVWHITNKDGSTFGIYNWMCDNAWAHDMVKGFFGFFSQMEGINWAEEYMKNPKKMPIQGHYINLASILISIVSYIVASFIHRSIRKVPKFNLDKMLHRGEYAIKGEHEHNVKKPATGWRTLLPSNEFSKGDKVIYWMRWIWAGILSIIFIGGTIWNLSVNKEDQWSDATWIMFWKYETIIMGICGAIVTVWFLIGGIGDMKYMFNKLKNIKRNDLDSGFVVGHHNLGDEAENEHIAEKDPE